MRQQGMGAVGAIAAMVIAGLIIWGIIYFGPSIWHEIQSGIPGSPETGFTSINLIVSSPESYDNKQVTVIGLFNQERYGLTEGNSVLSSLFVKSFMVNYGEGALYLRDGHWYKATGTIRISTSDHYIGPGQKIASAGEPYLSVADVKDIVPYDESATSIGTMVENPQAYANKQVTVIGQYYASTLRLVGEDGGAIIITAQPFGNPLRDKRWYKITGVTYYVQGVFGMDMTTALEVMWGQPLELG